MLVRQILDAKSHQGVETIKSSTSVSEAAQILAKHRFGALIVSEDGVTPAGILSERDIVRELGRKGAACMDEAVSGSMTKKLVSCSLDETADQVLSKMTEGRFRHMPVLEDGKMIGLISIGDVVKARLSQLAMEKNALEGMIMGY